MNHSRITLLITYPQSADTLETPRLISDELIVPLIQHLPLGGEHGHPLVAPSHLGHQSPQLLDVVVGGGRRDQLALGQVGHVDRLEVGALLSDLCLELLQLDQEGVGLALVTVHLPVVALQYARGDGQELKTQCNQRSWRRAGRRASPCGAGSQ